MDKFSENTEREVMSAVPTFDERGKARELIKDIAGECWRGRGDMVDRVFDAVSDAFPRSGWTRRRVRSFWHREAAAVRWGEMRELEFVAEQARTERIRREQAKAEHHEFIKRTNDLLDRLAASDEEFHSAHRAALRELASDQAGCALGTRSGEGAVSNDLGSSRIEGAY